MTRALGATRMSARRRHGAHREWREALARTWSRSRRAVWFVHELALMESVVDAVIAQTDGERIAVVRLEIGELAGVAIDALRFCFDVCAKGTTLEGAALAIDALPGRARCRACGGEHALRSFTTPCACGSFDRDLLGGTELRLVEVEV